jgi:hypothetical protein
VATSHGGDDDDVVIVAKQCLKLNTTFVTKSIFVDSNKDMKAT